MKTRLEAKLQPQTLEFISNIWHRVPPYGVENLNLYQKRPYNNNNSCLCILVSIHMWPCRFLEFLVLLHWKNTAQPRLGSCNK